VSERGVQPLRQQSQRDRIASLLETAYPSEVPEIRRRAYEFYEECGCEDGHDVEHWLRAEAEIMGTSLKAAA